MSNPLTTIVRGNPLPQLRKQIIDFNPTNGFLGKFSYDGADQTSMTSLQQDWIIAGCTSVLTLENDKASLEVTDSSQQYVIDSWEIVGNNEVRDLFSHPSFVSQIQATAGGTSDDLGNIVAQIREALANNQKPSDAFNAGGPLAAYDGTVVADFYTQYQLGDTGYHNAQYVIRHKTNVSNRWLVNISDFGINQLYTQAELLSEVSNSGLWIFPMPGRLLYKIGAIPAPDPQEGYLWSWLKSPSTETTAANNRVDIQTEYSLDLWFVEQYGLFDGIEA